MKHIGLFEGIGGFSLAARWMGWETVAWCEWNAFGQRVLRHHFPEAEGFGDITKTDFKKYANCIDILTGGFPCQPYSSAGKRLGTEDERHLWPEMLRAIREVQPCYVVGENVRGLTNWNGGMVFDQVQADLEAQGYQVLPFLLPACAVNAPHRRDRIWFIAHAIDRGYSAGRKPQTKANGIPGNSRQEVESREFNRTGFSSGAFAHAHEPGKQELQTDFAGNHPSEIRIQTADGFESTCYAGNVTDTNCFSSKRGQNIGSIGRIWEESHEFTSRFFRTTWQKFPTQPPLCSGNDGVSGGLDGITFSKWRAESVKAYGNAIVPQVAFQIFKAIQAFEDQYSTLIKL
jgi:DNA (cytosine-5)-methyltransferase 1